MRNPAWKILEAKDCLKKRQRSEHQDVNNVILLLSQDFPIVDAQSAFNECLEIYQRDFFIKEILESLFLCDDFSKEMAFKITGIPKLILDTYEMFFFDTSVFKYRLHKYEYVRTYNNPDFSDGKLYKSWALSTGSEFFYWKFANQNFEIVPKRAILSIMADSFFRAKEQLDEPITSLKAKESMRYIDKIPSLISSLKSIEEKKDSNYAEELRIALTYEDKTVKKDEISDDLILE